MPDFPVVFLLISLLGESEVSCSATMTLLSRPSGLFIESFERLYYNKVDLEPGNAELYHGAFLRILWIFFPPKFNASLMKFYSY